MSLKSKILFLLAMAMGGGQSFAEVRQDVFAGMSYQLSIPKMAAGSKYPLVVFLHGYSKKGPPDPAVWPYAYETAILGAPEVQEKHPAFLLEPLCPLEFRWVDTRWRDGSYDLDAVPESTYLEKVHALVLQVLATHPVDKSRVYVVGRSMGGFGTWDLVLRHPELFAAAIPICGSGSPAHAERIRNLPLRIFHGAKDPVVPVEGSREMAAALKAAGSHVSGYTEFPDGTHRIKETVWAVPGLADWLFGQKMTGREN